MVRQSFRYRRFITAILICFIFVTASFAQIKSRGHIQPKADDLLLIDDGGPDNSVGGTGNPGFGWFNQLKPDIYPATLKEVQIAFSNSSRGVTIGSPLKVVVYLD